MAIAGHKCTTGKMRFGTRKECTICSKREFASRLALMMAEAGQIGLLKTMHSLHAATQECGWEIADQIKKEPA